MRSIHTIKSGNAAKKNYYTQDESLSQNAQKKYYGNAETESKTQGKTQAIWFGKDAERLNLKGHAQQTDFEQIFDGYIPGTDQRIRGEKPRADHEENCIYDVVLTCKKSVSMQIHLGQDERLYQAYQDSVREIAELIEQDYAQARIQVNGDRRIVQTEGIIALMIPHHTSRELDMNVHTHLAIANGTYCSDGKWRSLLDRGFSHAYYMGDYFSARLAARVQALGYEIRETMTADGHPSWELAGFSEEQIQIFSKRSENAKVKALVASGMSRDEALLKTRKAKQVEETLEEAQERWQLEAQAHEIQSISPLHHPVQPKHRESAAQVLESAIRHYSHRSNHFTRDEMREYAFKLNRTFTISELDQAIAQHPALIDYGKIRDVDELKGHFTTVQALEREIRSLKAWMQGQEKATPILERAISAQALADVELKSGQRDAIIGVLASTHQHQMIHGLSGVGKTTALRHLKALTDAQGVEILGFAPSIDAAQKLSVELGIETHTVQKLVKQNLELNPNQLLVIDEAGMVSAEMLDTVLQKANAAGARILLVGDTGQNQAIEAGSPMRSLMRQGAEVHHIAEIIRQQNNIQRQAVELIATGNGLGALSLLNEHGYIQPIEDRQDRVSEIAAAYLDLSPEEQRNTLIVTGTNAEKDAITAEIRAGLKASGSLGESATVIQIKDRSLTPEEAQEIAYYRVGDYISLSRHYSKVMLQKDTLYQVVDKVEDELVVASPGGRLYHFNPKSCKDKQVFSRHEFDIAVGDSLRWLTTNRANGQINGDTFQVTAIEGTTATIITKDGIQQLDLNQPLAVDYTLTTTSYRAQGSDRPRVFVSATLDPTSNREPFYVSISRQIKELQIWTEDYSGLERRVAESSVQRNPLELIGDPHERHTTAARPDRDADADDLRSGESAAIIAATPTESDERTHRPGIESELVRPTDSPIEPEAEIGTRGFVESIDGSDSGEYGSVIADSGESGSLNRDLAALAELIRQQQLEAALIEPLQTLQANLERLQESHERLQDALTPMIESAQVEVLETAIAHWRQMREMESEFQVLELVDSAQERAAEVVVAEHDLPALVSLIQDYRAEQAIQEALGQMQAVIHNWQVVQARETELLKELVEQPILQKVMEVIEIQTRERSDQPIPSIEPAPSSVEPAPRKVIPPLRLQPQERSGYDTDKIQALRQLPLEDIAEQLGLVRDRRDKKKWRGEGINLSINGDKFYDWYATKGGVGAIDLVMHINQCDFKTAVQYLGGESVHSGFNIPIRVPIISESRPVKAPEKYPACNIRDESRWHQIQQYLVEQRGLPAEWVERLYQQGLISADGRGNVMFFRHELSDTLERGAAIGASLRGAQGNFKGLTPRGLEEDYRASGYFWFRGGEEEVNRIVLTESPIDAISLAVLERDLPQAKTTLYLSVDGAGEIPTTALSGMLERGGDVVVGFDHDRAGEEMYWKAAQKVPGMKRLVPEQGKDWNERLLGNGKVGFSLDQWPRIAKALGKPQDYLDLVAFEVAEAKTGELPPLPAKAFQHDCKTYQDTLDHLLVWHMVTYRLGYEPEYLHAITTVAIGLNQANNPTPVSAAFKEQMVADIAQWQKVSAERQGIAQAAAQLVKQFGTPYLDGKIFDGKTLQIISDRSSVIVSARRDGREILKVQGDEVVHFKPNAEELHKLRQLVKDVPKLMQQLHKIQRPQQSRGLHL